MEFYQIISLLFLFVFLVFLGGVFLHFYDQFFSIKVPNLINRYWVYVNFTNYTFYNATQYDTGSSYLYLVMKIPTTPDIVFLNSSGWFNYSAKALRSNSLKAFYSSNGNTWTDVPSCTVSFSSETYNNTNLNVNFTFSVYNQEKVSVRPVILSHVCSSILVDIGTDFYLRYGLLSGLDFSRSYSFNSTYNYTDKFLDYSEDSFDSSIKDKFETAFDYFFSWFGILIAFSVLVVLIVMIIGIFK